VAHPFRKEIINQIKSKYYTSPFEVNVVIISGYCCEFCNNLNGKYFEIEELFEDLKIHSSKCTRINGCNCTIGFNGKRDKNDRLIKSKTPRDSKYLNYI
jgi:hypothetical protein